MHCYLLLVWSVLLAGCATVAPVQQAGSKSHPFTTDFPRAAKLVGQYQQYTLTGASEALIATSVDGVNVFDASAAKSTVLHVPAGEHAVGYYYHSMRAAARVTLTFVAKDTHTYRLRAEQLKGSDNVRFWIEDVEVNNRVSDEAIEPLIDTGRRPLPLLITLP